MKKLLCILITLAMVIPCIGMVTVSAVDGVNASSSPQFTLAPDNFPSAKPVVGIDNGDAEDGLTNWETIHGGKIELVQPGANGTDNAVKFTPVGGIYNSVAFDLGPAIVDDWTEGYYGYGAGSYLVSFWAKAEKEGLFKVILNSQLHMSYESVNNHIPSLDTDLNTWIIADDVYLTTEWDYYSVWIDVSQEWLDMLALLKAYQVPNYERVYELEFRIDGSATDGDYAFKDDLFGYTVDEIMIEDILELFPDEKVFENGDAEDGLTNWETIHGGKIELVQPGANGTDNAVKFTPVGGIYNSVAFDLGPAIVDDWTEGYYGYGAGSYLVSFWAKAEKEGLFKVILNSQLHMDKNSVNNHIPSLNTDLNTWIIADDVYLTTEWDYYSVWIDVSQEWLDMLALLKEFQVPNYERVYELEFRIDGSATEGGDYAFKDDLFGYTVDEIMIEDILEPVGVIYTALEEIATEMNLFFRSPTGLITEADIEDGKITKSFKVGNLGEETIRVKLELQSTVKVDGVTKWAGQSDGEYIYIEPFTTETLTYTMDVNADYSVTVKGTDCELDTFFYRFDVENGDDEKIVPAGTSVVFYGEGEDYYIVSNLKNSVKNSWDIQDAYGYYSVNGWVEEDGNWYYYFLGEMLTETWWFDEFGFFYLDENGILVTDSWLFDGENWSYVGENGYLVTDSWVQDSVGWCYVDEEGYMVTNEWILDSVGWCYVGSDGYCLTDTWMKDSVGWCYLDSEGRMATNTWILDSVGWCYVGSDGYCVTNAWMKDSVGWVYLDSEGRMKTNAWVMDSVGWCYVGSDGYAVTNCWMADSQGWCYLDADGRMVTNDFVYDSNGRCYLNADGYWDGIYR